MLQDLTGGKAKTVDVSRLKPFFVVPGLDVQALASADLGEVRVEAVLAHRGDARKRGTMEFQVQWTDGDVTWEPWESCASSRLSMSTSEPFLAKNSSRCCLGKSAAMIIALM